MASYVDLTNPQRRRAAAMNVVNVYRATPPPVQQRGMQWYDRVHDAVAKGVRGTNTSEFGGAGLVAAVSPNMDWENNNIHALGELHGLSGAQWRDILRGDRASLAGLSISRAPGSGLAKAHRILEGEDPDEVMPRRTAPKVNSFAHNIYEPDVAGPVTIDGRAHDVAANRLQPWEANRGISSASLPTGKTTRYEHFESAYRKAAQIVSDLEQREILPHQVQAVTWEGAKLLERSGQTKSGRPRTRGVVRAGQPYVGRNALA